jgi:prepilin-type N-terminal cleavage/methylation domain-containing protein/prepilin-type processing-associated H-X9-DG protein
MGHRARAFSLIELLAVLAIIALLVSLLLPALGRAKSSGQSVACMNNLKQLQAGYLMYAHDNDDRFPLNRARRFGLNDVRNVEGSWVLGNTQRDTDTANIEAGTIYRDVGSAAVYRCPADKSTVLGTRALRTRSYSVQGWLNAYFFGKGFNLDPAIYAETKLKLSEVLDPPPSGVFAFIEEHEHSIDAGIFIIEQVPSINPDTTTGLWFSLPTDRHQQGCNLSFLDGHVEPWRWRAPKVFRQFLARANTDNSDLRRLQRALPRNKTPKPLEESK